MQFNNFKRIVTCFADRVDDVDTSHGELLVQIRDETITAKLHQRPNGLLVEEHDTCMPAAEWIVKRLARLPLLADRICSYVSPPEHFVPSSGRFLDKLEADPSGKDKLRPDVAKAMTQTLGRRLAGTTSVLYLTSDAGEGKTSLINEVAIRQAKAYKNKRSDWLLVPIPLGGRTFLRFDDVVVSALVNNLRFQFLYYDAFLELVQLGVLVPAFDGFEEMIVESSSGEAISALGNLVGKLRSAGTLLVAARKAYFDYPNFGSQARLFDTIGTDVSVAFKRLSLERWDRGTFTQYASKRQVDDPDGLFRMVAEHLGNNNRHPVLTRAVLVKRLVDVATEATNLSTLLDRIGQDQRDFFRDFVGGIVEREAREKWIDKSGDSSGVLLTTDEHHELLSMVAQEMWLSATDALAMDVVSLVVEMFADAREKSPAVARQIHERIKQHSLLAVTRMGRPALAFDHEDFRVFYLGQALGRAVAERDAGMLKSIIDKAPLPASTVAEAASSVRRCDGGALGETLALLQSLADRKQPASFVEENCGVLTLALVDRESDPYTIRSMNFPASALCERRLTNVTVSGSYFPATGLTELCHCTFVNCHFERLEIDGSEKVSHTSFDDACRVNTVVVRVGEDDGDHITRFDPKQIRNELIKTGFDVLFAPLAEPDADAEHDSDDDLVLVQRFLRSFLRATALNDGTVRRRLGVNANHFLNELLPRLQQAGVVQTVPYLGSGTQQRMRLLAPMSRIEEAMRVSGGKFEKFVQEVQRGAV